MVNEQMITLLLVTQKGYSPA